MKKIRLLSGAVVLMLGLIVSWTALASAHSFRSGDAVNVGQTEKVNQSLFAAGRNIDINTEVNGDIFCAGQTVNISGTVNGDVICAGQTIRISGKVNGDLRLAGQTVNVGAMVSGNATIAGQTFTLESDGVIEGDVTGAATDVFLNGEVGRDLAIGGSNISISGKIGRNIQGGTDNLSLSSVAVVGGNIDYTSDNELSIAEGAKVAGEVTRTSPPKSNNNTFAFNWGWFLYFILAMLFSAIMLVVLFPQVFRTVTEKAFPRPWKAILVGFLAGFIVPVTIVILLITVIGIPLAFLLMLMWGVILLLSGSFSAFYLGRIVLSDMNNTIGIMAGGAALLTVIYFVPLIGFIAFLGSTWLGTGMVLLELMRRTPRPEYAGAKKATKK